MIEAQRPYTRAVLAPGQNVKAMQVLAAVLPPMPGGVPEPGAAVSYAALPPDARSAEAVAYADAESGAEPGEVLIWVGMGLSGRGEPLDAAALVWPDDHAPEFRDAALDALRARRIIANRS